MSLAPSIWRISPISPKPIFFEFIQNQKGNIWIWEKPLWELVPCVKVTLVSKFHPIWCLLAQESKLRRKFLGGPDIYPIFLDISGRDRTYPAETGHIRSKVRHVCWTVFNPMFIHYFGNSLLARCPIDLILFLMHS
jgi:hypothetical protein